MHVHMVTNGNIRSRMSNRHAVFDHIFAELYRLYGIFVSVLADLYIVKSIDDHSQLFLW